MTSQLISQLKRDEGVRLKPYPDSVGKLTIGIGRNLTDVGISESEAEFLLNNDLVTAASHVADKLPWSLNLTLARQGILVNMAFNMGIGGLLGFKTMLAKAQIGDYDAAADAMLASQWANQVGPRAQRLAVQMRTGEWQ